MELFKRSFDILFSSIGLLACLPIFAVIAIIIKLDSRGPVFFRQERIGKGFEPFRIYKFRTMVADSPERGPLVTVAGDHRVTKVGGFLRKAKLDELPQLINVLKGDMSFVGPRPEVRKYVELFRGDYEKLLSVRPGITDPASLSYSQEEILLSSYDNWENEYTRRILPAKIKLSKAYVTNRSIREDIRLILRTIFRL